MPNCENGHDWAPTGVFVEGNLHVQCKNPKCNAEMKQTWEPITGPGMSIDGMELDIEDDPQGTVAKTVCRGAAGKYDDLNLQPGDVVVDIGAHVGIISIYLAKRYPGIRVYAFEPTRANFQRLMRNIEANNVLVNVARLAVTSDGRLTAVGGNASMNSGGYSIYQDATEPGGYSTTLANIMEREQIDHIALLKIDCEGAEYEILNADPSLLDRVTYLRGEFHLNEQRGWDPEALVNMCAKHIKPENIKLDVSRAG